MDSTFRNEEKLFRAVYPPEVVEMFRRFDGRVSSAAFADPKGLSVDREGDRTVKQVVSSLNDRFSGRIIYVRVKNCLEAGASVKYLPSAKNPYHSEIHGNDSVVLLSKSQRRFLASRAVEVV